MTFSNNKLEISEILRKFVIFVLAFFKQDILLHYELKSKSNLLPF